MFSFDEQFGGKIEEIFLYITYRCNLKCLHCYMGEPRNIDMPVETCEPMLKKLSSLGATKITFLGGEPTLHPFLGQFINIAKSVGFNYLRLDTNGQFESRFLENPDLKSLNDISFSLEGIDAKTHGAVRSVENYHSLTNNIKKAIALGFIARVTTTINSLNLSQVEEITSWLENIGVSVLNLHLTCNNGRARNNQWLFVKEQEWMNFYRQILPKLQKYNIEVKIPKRYINANEANQNNEITCETAKSTRVGITPDCRVYSCPLLLDSNRYFAYFHKGEFVCRKNYQNHILTRDKVKDAACPILMQENYEKYKREGIIPLCVSYKQTNKD